MNFGRTITGCITGIIEGGVDIVNISTRKEIVVTLGIVGSVDKSDGGVPFLETNN